MTDPSSRVLSSSRLRHWVRWVGFVLSVLLFFYVALVVRGIQSSLPEGQTHRILAALPGAVALVLLGLTLRALRWHYYVRISRWPIPFHYSIAAFVASISLTLSPGKAGEVIKSALLADRFGVPVVETAGALVVERLGDLIAVLLLAGLGLFWWVDASVSVLVLLVIAVSLIGFVVTPQIHRPLFALVGRIPILSKISDQAQRLIDAGRRLLAPKPFAVGCLLALVAWGCEGIALWLIVQTVDFQLPVWSAVFVFSISTVAGVVSMLPGGVGGFEAVMVLLLSKLGLAAGVASVPVSVFRMCTLWLGSLLGLIVLAGWLIWVPRNSQPPSMEAKPS